MITEEQKTRERYTPAITAAGSEVESLSEALPTVALAGRPNVGKSTLFNRLLRSRRAITDPTPGVTRDPVAVNTRILGRPVRLIDTGGFKMDRNEESPEGALERIVVERTLAVLKNADVIVLLFEAGELSLEDEEFVNLLRPYQPKLIAAVNKTEGGRREAEAWNLLSFGFENVFMISAEHGDNIRNLEEAIAARIDSLERPAVPQDGPEAAHDRESVLARESEIHIALLGKPNTGKSTLSNRLTSSTASIVTDIPGTTRDVVEGSFVWKDRRFRVLDTAGIRRKSKVSENIEYYSVNRAIKTIDEADIVFLIIDAAEGLTEQDKKIAALAHDKGRALILALNKWDTMPEIKNTFEAVRDRIHFLFGHMEYAPIIPVSAQTGSGVDALLNTAIRMHEQLNREVATPALNQALEKWLKENPPPAMRQGSFKIRYAVQTGKRPVSFVFFTTRSEAVSESCIAYLRNRIRSDLGFSLIPVSVEIRASGSSEGKDRTRGSRGSSNKRASQGESRGNKANKPKTKPTQSGNNKVNRKQKRRT